jgi:hypothetical protein
MDAVLLDTDVFSYLSKEGDTRAELYRRTSKEKRLRFHSSLSASYMYGP